ncbi:MAG: SprT family zinc-dependent metalloprotease [Pseudomonadota bacterium]
MFRDKGQKVALYAKNGSEVIVRLEVNARAKRLIVRLDESAREAVAVAPHRRDLPAATAFARDRVDWIAEQLSLIPAPLPFRDGGEIPFQGAVCQLSLSGSGRRAQLVAEPRLTLSAPGAPETFAARVSRYLKRAAKTEITRSVGTYCDALGVTAQRISVKDTRSRWGSCTADGCLSFSWRLICAPPRVLDYVAAHECAHLLEMNHSDRFWGHVNRICPDWRRDRAWLRAHGRALHAIGAPITR